MVVTKINGGLGNQLFQYAAGKALAVYRGVELKLDVKELKKDEKRKYELDKFNITASTATDDEINTVVQKNGPRYVRLLRKLLQKIKPYYLRRVYREPHFHFDPNFLRALENVYLSGYWQSEKYFKRIEPDIIKEFKPGFPLTGRNKELAKKIREKNSISIHIRRGDYAENVRTRNYHGLVSLDYYKNALETINDKVESPHFFIFSDEIEWARLNLKISFPLTFVDNNNEETAYEDFCLMRLCKHHIIANSSFSWWAAWLSENRSKIVIAPRRWFKTKELDSKDLVPEQWLKL